MTTTTQDAQRTAERGIAIHRDFSIREANSRWPLRRLRLPYSCDSMRRTVIALLAAIAAASIRAEEPAVQSSKSASSRTPAIQDNSLFVEEAYNQEPGIVQHINVFLRDLRTNRWFATFTQEYPMGGVRHQASYTIPYQQVDTGADSPSGLGDVAL